MFLFFLHLTFIGYFYRGMGFKNILPYFVLLISGGNNIFGRLIVFGFLRICFPSLAI